MKTDSLEMTLMLGKIEGRRRRGRQRKRWLDGITDAMDMRLSRLWEQYVNRELPEVQAGFRKGRGTRDQIAGIEMDHGKSNKVPEKHLSLLY